MIPDTPAELIDHPRRLLGQIEDAMARTGWPFSGTVSSWVDALVLEIEDQDR